MTIKEKLMVFFFLLVGTSLFVGFVELAKDCDQRKGLLLGTICFLSDD